MYAFLSSSPDILFQYVYWEPWNLYIFEAIKQVILISEEDYGKLTQFNTFILNMQIETYSRWTCLILEFY